MPYQEIQQSPDALAVLTLSKGLPSLRSSSGEMFLKKTDRGMRIELSGFSFVAGEGDPLDPEIFSDGAIEGELDRLCEVLVVDASGPLNNGVLEAQFRTDDTWSSPFCAQYR
jgi:hypothetical protein